MLLRKQMNQIFLCCLLVLSSYSWAKPDFIGNIIGRSIPRNFTKYWNQVTSENAAKWGSVESSRGRMNFGAAKQHAAFAKKNGMPYKFHTLVWGSQEPGWIRGLSKAEQLKEIKEWMQAVKNNFNPEYIDVVNEPLHAPPSYRDALGGSGSTGWDWVIESFKLARKYFPRAKLHLNDYGIISDGNAINKYLKIINLLKSRGLIDGVGIQCHKFNLDHTNAGTVKRNLDRLSGPGLPIYATEWDISGNDSTQERKFKELFPVFYNHRNVKGITLWGYIQGQTWKANTHLVNSGSNGVKERPAMRFLKQYLRK